MKTIITCCKLILWTIGFLFFVACEDDQTGDKQRATVSLSVERSNVTLAYANQSEMKVKFTAKEDWTTQIVYQGDEKDWLELSPGSGTAGDNLDLVIRAIEANEGDEARQATVTIRCGTESHTLNVSQEFCDPIIYILNSDFSIGYESGNQDVATFDIDVDWVAEVHYEGDDQDWLNVSPLSGSAGNGIELTMKSVSENLGMVARTAVVTILYGSKSHELTLVQAAREQLIEIGTTSYSLAAAANSETEAVFSIKRDWSVSVQYEGNEQDWLEITPESGAAGDGIRLGMKALSANRGSAERKAIVNILFESETYPLTVTQQFEAGNIAADFDPIFAALLKERGIISDVDKILPAEVEGVKTLNLSGTASAYGNLVSLAGIEYFKALQVLLCEYNQITSLDLSGNPELFEFRCSYNQLETLDLSHNSKLDKMYALNNQLKTIIFNNPALRLFYVGNNQLEGLDLSGLNKDKVLGMTCSGNPGKDGKFIVKAWFDNSAIPANFTNSGWEVSGNVIEIEYQNVMN